MEKISLSCGRIWSRPSVSMLVTALKMPPWRRAATTAMTRFQLARSLKFWLAKVPAFTALRMRRLHAPNQRNPVLATSASLSFFIMREPRRRFARHAPRIMFTEAAQGEAAPSTLTVIHAGATRPATPQPQA
jgi:hypothetical protein